MTLHKNNKFRGGVRFGAWCNSWPFGVLEIHKEALVLRDVLLGREIKFLKDEIEKIEIKKSFPLIGYYIRIYSGNSSQNDFFAFGYWSLHFEKLLDALKEFNYL
ncbi:hypothetical protein JXD20_02365 [Candidatus Peregrinibacteria bacterium]|nr:hypothetical protein [Candidatus Peregrinibacteria bacterium]